MRFFTPELYLRFNSPDDEVADRAEQQWEEATSQYAAHLAALAAKLPGAARQLSQTPLHDAELLAVDQQVEPSLQQPLSFAAVLVRLDDQVYNLVYLLHDQIRWHAPPADWPFSGEQRHWLYDEWDEIPQRSGRFEHRILLSDGNIVEIPCKSLLMHSFPATLLERSHESNRSA